jgi:hypothetical protein
MTQHDSCLQARLKGDVVILRIARLFLLEGIGRNSEDPKITGYRVRNYLGAGRLNLERGGLGILLHD